MDLARAMQHQNLMVKRKHKVGTKCYSRCTICHFATGQVGLKICMWHCCLLIHHHWLSIHLKDISNIPWCQKKKIILFLRVLCLHCPLHVILSSDSHHLPRKPPLDLILGQAQKCLKLMPKYGLGACAFASVEEYM